MTSKGYKFGHQEIIGNPEVDWSHASSYLSNLNEAQGEEDPESVDLAAEQAFREDLITAHGVDDLPKESRSLADKLATADGVDISYFPGGSNYQVSLVSNTNPLGLPGDLWALVSDATEGALVAALVRLTGDGELEVKFPDGHDWTELSDPSVISDYDIVGVTPDAVNLFQNYDRDNTLGVISSYPISDKGPFPTEAQLAVPMSKEIPQPRSDDDEYWANSGERSGEVEPVSAGIESVVIEDADDLDAAITAAVEDSDIRWYVERRIEALGLEADLPWLKD